MKVSETGFYCVFFLVNHRKLFISGLGLEWLGFIMGMEILRYRTSNSSTGCFCSLFLCFWKFFSHSLGERAHATRAICLKCVLKPPRMHLRLSWITIERYDRLPIEKKSNDPLPLPMRSWCLWTFSWTMNKHLALHSASWRRMLDRWYDFERNGSLQLNGTVDLCAVNSCVYFQMKNALSLLNRLMYYRL